MTRNVSFQAQPMRKAIFLLICLRYQLSKDDTKVKFLSSEEREKKLYWEKDYTDPDSKITLGSTTPVQAFWELPKGLDCGQEIWECRLQVSLPYGLP